MEGVRKIVETVLTVSDRATGPFDRMARSGRTAATSMMSATQAASGLNAVANTPAKVFRAMPSAAAAASPFSAIAGAGSRVLGVLGSMASGVIGVARSLVSLSSMSALSNIHSQFEDTQIAIGGMLNALGVSGSFERGMEDAGRSMQSIMAAAAALPGEAEDYISVFQTALPQIRESLSGLGQNQLSQWTDFSNRVTAAGIMFGVNSGVIGRHLSLMLRSGQGGATQAMKTFTKLLPFMRTLEGQANITATSFNRMTQPQRARILQETMGKLGPMLDASANTMSAIRGSLATTAKTLLRLGTAPLFNAAKTNLAALNSLFVKTNGDLTPLGQKVVAIGKFISTYIVKNWNDFLHAIPGARKDLTSLFGSVERNPFIVRLMLLGRSMRAIIGSLAMIPEIRQLAVGGLARAAFGPIGLLLGPLAALAAHTTAVSTIMGTAFRIIDTLFLLLAPAVGAMSSINTMLGDFLAGVLPGLFSAVLSVLQPAVIFLRESFRNVSAVLEVSRATLAGFFNSIGAVLSAAGAYLGVVLALIFGQFERVYSLWVTYALPVVRLVIQALTWLYNTIATAVRFIAETLGVQVANRTITSTLSEGEESGGSGGFMDRIRSAIAASSAATAAETAAARASSTTPGARGGHTTNNDFRNSRFDISQSFAEGFDPDRIAVAFTQDLERVSDQRLQSGLEPAFAIR